MIDKCFHVSTENTKDASLLVPKHVQHGMYASKSDSAPLSMPSLVPTSGERLGPGTAGVQAALTAAMLLQRKGEEERWLARQRSLRVETGEMKHLPSEGLQLASEPETHELRRDTQR